MTTGGDKAVNKEELGKGQQQVAESRARLLKLKADRDLDVSAVRISGDERESQRRTKEEDQRQVIIFALWTVCSVAVLYGRRPSVNCHISATLLSRRLAPAQRSIHTPFHLAGWRGSAALYRLFCTACTQ